MVGFFSWRFYKFLQKLFFVKNYYLNLNLFLSSTECVLLKNKKKIIEKKPAI